MTKQTKGRSHLYWIAIGAFFIGLALAQTLFIEIKWLTYAFGGLLAGSVLGLIVENRAFLKTRTAAFGINSIITVLLVISIIGVLNFLSYRYPFKKDVTKNQKHTLTDQSKKVVGGLQSEVTARFFAKTPVRPDYRDLLSSYSSLSPQFKVKYVDPFRDFAEVKKAGIKRTNTLVLSYGKRTQKVATLEEEKITNALIKLTKEKNQTLCYITGHGEKDFQNRDPEGYEIVRKQLVDQANDVKEVNLPREGEIPSTCNAIAILGPIKEIFKKEVQAIDAYLTNGGRAIIGLDVNVEGQEFAPDLARILEKWNIRVHHSLIIDPLSRGLGSDFTIPVIKTFNKSHPITKEQTLDLYFPLTQHFEEGKKKQPDLKVQWLAKSYQTSWAESDFSQIKSGQVKADAGIDKKGALITAIAAEGKLKDSKAKEKTRIIAFGTSLFSSNRWSRAGGNLDFFLNSVSWILEDDQLISIRKEGDDKVELSYTKGRFIFVISVIFLPLAIAVTGTLFWWIRRKY